MSAPTSTGAPRLRVVGGEVSRAIRSLSDEAAERALIDKLQELIGRVDPASTLRVKLSTLAREVEQHRSRHAGERR
jgi:hypothetical protein